MDQGMFDGLEKLYRWTLFILIILIPLALIKLFEIAIWLFTHIDITWN